jgi:hypothetical protein
MSGFDPSSNRPSIPDLVWPARVTIPTRPPALVYLDLNHYIYLTRAADGDPTAPSGYEQLLASSSRAYQDGRAVFPLSGTHYIEMSAIRDPAQRAAVAAVMEKLSSFRVLLGRSTIAELEIESMLDLLLGQPSEQDHPVPLLGTSGLWAFGRKGGIRLGVTDSNDVSSTMRAELGAEPLEKLLADINRILERTLLRGPTDAEEPQLRTRGYAPERAHAITEQRAQQEREQAGRLDADQRWRRGRLRDVISARELSMELGDALTTAVMRRNTTLGQVINYERQFIRAFVEGMPSCRVAVTLKTRYHRNPNHRWSGNDINDIDALSVAVAYCDAVFTDKAARNALSVAPELRPLNTFLPRKPHDLSDWLDAL